MPLGTRATIYIDEETLSVLDRRVKESGLSRSALMREYIRDGAGITDSVEPLSKEQLVRLLERHAAAGSVKATELLLMKPWEPKKPAQPKRVSSIDRLAAA